MLRKNSFFSLKYFYSLLYVWLYLHLFKTNVQMIQRKQTVYLLAQIAVLCVLFFVPFAEFITADGLNINFVHNNITTEDNILLSTFPVTVIIVLIILLAFFTVFLYKNRKLQIRFCVYNAVMSVGILIMMMFYIYQINSNMEITASNYKVWMAIPIASLFCSIQALRGIRKDDILVKSYDRLR